MNTAYVFGMDKAMALDGLLVYTMGDPDWTRQLEPLMNNASDAASKIMEYMRKHENAALHKTYKPGCSELAKFLISPSRMLQPFYPKPVCAPVCRPA